MNIRAEHIQAILANPFYAMTVAPQLVQEHALEMSDEQWVQTNAHLMQDMGAEQWLAQVLAFLQSGDVSRLSDPRMNPCHAVIMAPIFCDEHVPIVSQPMWEQSSGRLMQEMGVESWLMQLLTILEGDYVTTDEIIPPSVPGTNPHGRKRGKLRRIKRKQRGF